MSHTPSSAPPGATTLPTNPTPTPYAALNVVLIHFVERVRELLADNFVGAYLQGSFALGDFDEQSDVDFLIVVERDIGDAEVPLLNALHTAIHDFPPPWGHRLEGSYIPATILRRRSDTPREPPGAPPRPPSWTDPGTGLTAPRAYPLLFLDHGARTLVRSEHDDTQVVRWMARERGIVLVGPDPRSLIDEVSADALRIEMRETMACVAAKFLRPYSAGRALAADLCGRALLPHAAHAGDGRGDVEESGNPMGVDGSRRALAVADCIQRASKTVGLARALTWSPRRGPSCTTQRSGQNDTMIAAASSRSLRIFKKRCSCGGPAQDRRRRRVRPPPRATRRRSPAACGRVPARRAPFLCHASCCDGMRPPTIDDVRTGAYPWLAAGGLPRCQRAALRGAGSRLGRDPVFLASAKRCSLGPSTLVAE